MTKKKEYNLPEFVYYDQNLDLFKIQRNGVYYNSFKSLREAKEHLILLERMNYDFEEYKKSKEYKKFLKKKTQSDKNYTYVPAKFVPAKFIVRKRIKGKIVYFDSFKTELEAKKCVALLKSLNWDKEEYRKIRNKE